MPDPEEIDGAEPPDVDGAEIVLGMEGVGTTPSDSAFSIVGVGPTPSDFTLGVGPTPSFTLGVGPTQCDFTLSIEGVGPTPNKFIVEKGIAGVAAAASSRAPIEKCAGAVSRAVSESCRPGLDCQRSSLFLH